MDKADGPDDATRIETGQIKMGKTGGSLLVGTLLGHTYRITGFIARGGMGEVYRAHHDTLGTDHAIKIIRPELADQPDVVELFRREAVTLRRIHDRAIVSYDGLFRDEAGRTYLAMEYVDGPSLSDVMAERRLTADEVRILRRRLAAGLAVAHEQGVFHRDLSPDNVIFVGGHIDQAKIIDFGIAKLTDGEERTVIGDQFAGKYSYVAPEQFGLYGGKVDGRTDIYSLGLLLAAAALGRRLDMGNSLQTAIAKRESVPDLSALPGELQAEIAAMLAPAPENRPPSMTALMTGEVTAAPQFAGIPGSSPPTVPPTRLSKPGRSGMTVAALLAALAVIAGGGTYFVLNPFEPEPVPVSPTPTPTPTPAPTPAPQPLAPPVTTTEVKPPPVQPDPPPKPVVVKPATDVSPPPVTQPTVTQPTVTPAPPVISPPVTEATPNACDRLAADPVDPNRVTDGGQAIAGVAFETIDSSAAIAACTEATGRFPTVSRFQFQLGRALYAAGRFADAAVQQRTAAEAGYASARNDLGVMYFEGKGVPKDLTMAAHWLSLAASDGEPSAQATYGYMLEQGLGVAKNLAEARIWYRRAADQGNVSARQRLDKLGN